MRKILTAAILLTMTTLTAIGQDTPDWLLSPNLNTVLSLQHEAEMRKFYGETLGLESLPDSDLPARIGRPFDTINVGKNAENQKNVSIIAIQMSLLTELGSSSAG